jgi:hypothetical protein
VGELSTERKDAFLKDHPQLTVMGIPAEASWQSWRGHAMNNHITSHTVQFSSVQCILAWVWFVGRGVYWQSCNNIKQLCWILVCWLSVLLGHT